MKLYYVSQVEANVNYRVRRRHLGLLRVSAHVGAIWYQIWSLHSRQLLHDPPDQGKIRICRSLDERT